MTSANPNLDQSKDWCANESIPTCPCSLSEFSGSRLRPIAAWTAAAPLVCHGRPVLIFERIPIFIRRRTVVELCAQAAKQTMTDHWTEFDGSKMFRIAETRRTGRLPPGPAGQEHRDGADACAPGWRACLAAPALCCCLQIRRYRWIPRSVFPHEAPRRLPFPRLRSRSKNLP
jgi:hypothetical protein